MPESLLLTLLRWLSTDVAVVEPVMLPSLPLSLLPLLLLLLPLPLLLLLQLLLLPLLLLPATAAAAATCELSCWKYCESVAFACSWAKKLAHEFVSDDIFTVSFTGSGLDLYLSLFSSCCRGFKRSLESPLSPFRWRYPCGWCGCICCPAEQTLSCGLELCAFSNTFFALA